MNLLKKLWSDEAGVILSAEAAVVGTVAIVGIATGLTVVAKGVNEELKEVGFAIRSLDQSYKIPSNSACGASTAGSEYVQQPVKVSLQELQKVCEKAEKEEQQQAERLKKQMEMQKQKNKKPNKKKGNV
ncbi:MAG: hypothetical protein KDA81_06030 [Planctomycetaceae bacterium]|nr:hypothetical protein [Planctomycetaceae bacterium]